MKTKIVELWRHVLSDNKCQPCESGVLIPMQGHTRFEDFYLCVPKTGVHTRSANAGRYGQYKREYFIDGEIVGAGRAYKEDKVKALYTAGHIQEARQYVTGVRLWRETTLGGRKINKYKEAARISHELCDMPGKSGHEARQIIRKQILKTL